MKYMELNRNRVDAIVELWNKELKEDFPMRKELFEQNSFDDMNVSYEGSCIALDEMNNVIGFIVVKRWQESFDLGMGEELGWIQTLLVDQNYRGRGIGTYLLNHAESELRTHGIKKIRLGGDPWHYFPGVPTEYTEVNSWFEAKGYVNNGEEHDLKSHSNKRYTLPDNDRIYFSLLKRNEEKELLAFLHESFPGRWEYEAIKYFEKQGNGREFVVLKDNGRIIGFCRINDNKSPFIAQNVYWDPLFNFDIGGIGPLGIDSNQRKKGYGVAIIKAALNFLQERGIRDYVIDWTGLTDFYSKLEFETWKSYYTYDKTIN